MDTTINNGKRAGTYQAFIKPFLYRQNLHVLRYAHVIKVSALQCSKLLIQMQCNIYSM